MVVEHPAGYIACLHSQDNRLHQVAGSLDRQQSERRQWFTRSKLSLSKNTLIRVKTNAPIKLRAALESGFIRALDISIDVISFSQVGYEDADQKLVFCFYHYHLHQVACNLQNQVFIQTSVIKRSDMKYQLSDISINISAPIKLSLRIISKSCKSVCINLSLSFFMRTLVHFYQTFTF